MSRRVGRGRRTVLVLAAAGLVSFVSAQESADELFRSLAAAAQQPEPLMRIGLEPADRITLSAVGSFRIIDPQTGKDIWKPVHSGEVVAVPEGSTVGGVASVFRIQVGAYSLKGSAEEARDRLSGELGVPAVVRRDPDRGNWRVRVGEAADRDALNGLLEKLRSRGLRDIWIVEEPAREPGDVTLRLVDASWQSFATDRSRLAVVPVGRARIRVEGKPYRGVIELRVSSFGRLLAVNWIGLETYLLGVVPAELGPEVWPQLEALKAQAVAARTYAWGHRGQFVEDGFDLCATPRCQVYGGASAEHPMSDRAVSETRGEILTWEGEPISALYTATCGGHTEDAGEIFPEEAAPYLKGVPCRAEDEALSVLRAALTGRPQVPVIAEEGTDVTRDIALLTAAGVVDERKGRWREPAEASAVRAWSRALAQLAGRPVPEGETGPVRTLAEAVVTMVEDLGWSERARVLLDTADLEALLRDPEAAALPQAARRALAYLAFAQAMRPFADGRYHVGEAPSAARLLPVLVRIGEAYEAFGLTEAVFAGETGGRLRLLRGMGETELPLVEQPYLFGLSGGRGVPSERLELWPGDRVRYRTDEQGRIDFLEMMPPVKGSSDDRAAAVYSWEVRKSRRQLDQLVNQRVGVGRLVDLRVARRGRSGRVVELEVVGEGATSIVRGFDIRRLLGLRESLTVIEIQRDAAGSVVGAVFAGKGWGHGVGLCQVGGYGMALRGSSYREILAHYYRGARLTRIVADPDG